MKKGFCDCLFAGLLAGFAGIAMVTIMTTMLSVSPALAQQQCGYAGTVEACVACVKKKGIAGPSGGYRWCSENVPKANAAKAAKQKK
jgi:hypothetical protein